MTAREQAEIHIFGQVVGKEIGDALIDGDVRRLTETIQSAILAEREACAKIAADTYQASIDVNERCEYAGHIERSIRARSNAPETEKEITVKMPPKSRQAGIFTPNPAQTIDPKENIAPDPISA